MGLKNLEDSENVSYFFNKNTMIKVIIIGLIYAISLYVFLFLFQFLQVRPIPGDPLLGFVLSFIAGVIISLVLGFVSIKFTFSFVTRYILIFSILFILAYAIHIIDYIIYSTTPLYVLYYGFAINTALYIVITAVIAFLFSPPDDTDSLITQLRNLFSGHSTNWWIFRVLIAGALYYPIYFIFGLMIWPIVEPYYTDPSQGLELKVPSFAVIIPIQLARGIVYVIVLISLIVMAVREGYEKWKLVLFLTAILGGLVLPGYIADQSWPIVLRVAHGLEITAGSFFHSLVIVKLFGKFSKKEA